jgi:hypothetical protein
MSSLFLVTCVRDYLPILNQHCPKSVIAFPQASASLLDCDLHVRVGARRHSLS